MVSFDSPCGLTYSVPVSSLVGAEGAGLTLGTNKLVCWYAGRDFGGNFIECCKLRITATDGSLPSAPSGMLDTLDGAGSATANIYIDQFYMDRYEVSKGWRQDAAAS